MKISSFGQTPSGGLETDSTTHTAGKFTSAEKMEVNALLERYGFTGRI